MIIIIIYYCNLVKLELSTNSCGINWESTKSRFLSNWPLESTYSTCHHNRTITKFSNLIGYQLSLFQP